MAHHPSNRNKAYGIAIHNGSGRPVCVTIKKYNDNKPPNIQIGLFTAKEKEAMKKVVYVNYTLNKFKEFFPIFGRYFVC